MATVEDVLMVKGPDVVVADPGDTVLAAAKLMAAARVGSVIIRDGRDVVGIFTERDLLCKIVAPGKDPARTPLREVMSSPVQSCCLSDDLDACAERMTKSHLRHLAIIEDGALVGLIGLRDVLTMRPR